MITNSIENVVVKSHSSKDVFKFKVGKEEIIFNMLIDKLYSNPLYTVLQEILQNARDSHRETNKEDKRIKIKILPLENTIEIRDFGVGISPERMRDVFVVFGETTKRNKKEHGGFGIGASSVWSYSDFVSIDSFIKGIKYSYIGYIDTNGIPLMEKVSEEKTNEPDGLLVKFNFKAEDLNKIEKYIYKITYFWDVKPEIENSKLKYNYVDLERDSIINFGNVYIVDKDFIDSRVLNQYYYNDIILIYDGLMYKVMLNGGDSESSQNSIFVDIIDFYNRRNSENFVILIKAGVQDVDISLNREEIKITKKTKEFIVNSLKNFSDELRFKHLNLIHDYIINNKHNGNFFNVRNYVVDINKIANVFKINSKRIDIANFIRRSIIANVTNIENRLKFDFSGTGLIFTNKDRIFIKVDENSNIKKERRKISNILKPISYNKVFCFIDDDGAKLLDVLGADYYKRYIDLKSKFKSNSKTTTKREKINILNKNNVISYYECEKGHLITLEKLIEISKTYDIIYFERKNKLSKDITIPLLRKIISDYDDLFIKDKKHYFVMINQQHKNYLIKNNMLNKFNNLSIIKTILFELLNNLTIDYFVEYELVRIPIRPIFLECLNRKFNINALNLIRLLREIINKKNISYSLKNKLINVKEIISYIIFKSINRNRCQILSNIYNIIDYGEISEKLLTNTDIKEIKKILKSKSKKALELIEKNMEYCNNFFNTYPMLILGEKYNMLYSDNDYSELFLKYLNGEL